MTDVAERLAELRERGLHRRLRLVEGPQGPRVLLDGREVLLLCSNNYLGLADHPRVREAAAEAALRWGAGAGASRLISGNMEPHRRAGGAAGRLQGLRGGAAVRLRLPGEHRRRSRRSPAPARSSSPTSSTTPASSTAAGSPGPRPSSTATATSSTSPGGWREAAGRGSLIVTDGVFSMDGDVAPLTELLELARRHGCRLMVDEAHATGAIGPGGRGSVAAAGLSGEVDVVVGTLGKALGSYGAYVCAERGDGRLPRQHAPARSSSRPRRRPPPSAPRSRRWTLLEAEPRAGRAAAGERRRPARRRSPPRASPRAARQTQIVPVEVGEAERDDGALRAGARARRLRPGDPPADGPRGLLAPALHGDGDPPPRRAATAPPREVGAAAREIGLLAADASRGLSGERRSRCLGRAASSSPAPGPRSARPWSPRCSPAPTPRRAGAVAVFKPGRHRPRRGAGAAPTTQLLRLRRGLGAQSDDEIAPYRFGPPASPHLAAALAGEEIEPERVLAAARAAAGRRRGLRLRGRRRPARPARRAATWSATSRSTSGCRWSIAAAPGLGTINHTLLTIEVGPRRRPRGRRGRPHPLAEPSRARSSARTARRSPPSEASRSTPSPPRPERPRPWPDLNC